MTTQELIDRLTELVKVNPEYGDRQVAILTSIGNWTRLEKEHVQSDLFAPDAWRPDRLVLSGPNNSRAEWMVKDL